ncbi:hypothetical protein AB0I16_33250 [Streptomyces sp. NPDC050703]|uniref:deoxynucleotide monophosphate kinase family protein n=1 Tax=Streptomyces sp. NPDC050703 TaxID=3157218 RepID=UPI003423F8B4
MSYYRNVGLIGRARAGKDTVAERLAQRFAYQPVAFADKLKDAALRANPIIDYVNMGAGAVPSHAPVTLSEIVAADGWESAKDNYPEVRRFLQNYGQTVREIDPEFWIRAATPAIAAAERLGLPVVVTDVRYLNEVVALQQRGFTMIRVNRPGSALGGAAAEHLSETELDDYVPRLAVENTGTLEDLKRVVDTLALPHNY